MVYFSLPKRYLRLSFLMLVAIYACLLLGLQFSQAAKLRRGIVSSSMDQTTLLPDFNTAWSQYAGMPSLFSSNAELDSIAEAPPLPRLEANNHFQVSFNNSNNQTNNLWEGTDLPEWMKEYFAWHKQQRALLNESNWRDFKYIVMQCTVKDKRCGGTADRLKPIPMVILVGYLSRRILLIHWEMPKPLQEFLLPPIGGLDWRMPLYLVPAIGYRYPHISSDSRMKSAMSKKTRALTWNLRYQTYHSGSQFFNQHKPLGSLDFGQVYHATWKVLFTPSPPIARQIEQFMQQHGLVPGEYAAAHVRAQYSTRMERPKFHTQLLTRNALNCASTLFPGGPIFLASDDPYANEEALVYGAQRHSPIVTRSINSSSSSSSSNITTVAPLHLDMAGNPESRRASEYYDTFVDLYLMGMSRCVTYNKGNFGHWALLMSYNVSCKIRHQFNLDFTKCRWTKPRPKQRQPEMATTNTTTANTTTPTLLLTRHVFVPPMLDLVL